MGNSLLRLAANIGLVVLVALAVASSAHSAQARNANLRFDGGTTAERSKVRAALRTSSFDWSIIRAEVTVHIVRGIDSSEAAPGEIWLDADLLETGMFAWGVVQHEFAHQVDFFCLDDAARTLLRGQLGGTGWWLDIGARHSDAASERFASTLAWSYWPSRLNVMSPASAGVESGSIPAARFRALLPQILASCHG
jgi:hypothetical protein